MMSAEYGRSCTEQAQEENRECSELIAMITTCAIDLLKGRQNNFLKEINLWFDSMSNFIKVFCLRFTDDFITNDKVNDKINISF